MKFEKPRCICGSRRSWFVSWSDSRKEVARLLGHDGFYLALRQCSRCGQGFTSPYPDEELLDVYYRGLYRTEDDRIDPETLFRNELHYGLAIRDWLGDSVRGKVLDVSGSARISGNVSINTDTNTNILTVQQTSATDPIADDWTIYSTLDSKADISPVDTQKLTAAASRVKAVSMIEFKRPMPLDEPFPLDYFDLPMYEDVELQDASGELQIEKKLVDVWTAEEQYEAALAEWQAAKANPKFTQPRLGVDANDPSVPAHWRAYNQEGQVVGVNLGAQVGDLLATVKAQQQAIEALQLEVNNLKARVSKLEGVKTP